jgi:hypothetical protein
MNQSTSETHLLKLVEKRDRLEQALKEAVKSCERLEGHHLLDGKTVRWYIDSHVDYWKDRSEVLTDKLLSIRGEIQYIVTAHELQDELEEIETWMENSSCFLGYPWKENN